MNMRERMLAVVRGEEHDLVPFAQYEMDSMPNPKDVWSEFGHDNFGIMRWLCVHRTEFPHCRFKQESIEDGGLRGVHTVLQTPEGLLEEDTFFEPAMGTAAIRNHYVRKPEDYRVLMSYFNDMVVTQDLTQLKQCEKDYGDNGLPHVMVERTPFQQLWIQWVSLQDLCIHMMDYPELLEECMALMVRNQIKIFEAVCTAPIPYVVFPDNITAPVIGESYFRSYCMPMYEKLYDMLGDRDIPIYAHMDGDLKPLWPAISESAVRGLDSFSPPPDNDTNVSDAVGMWPEMRLSLNFPSSVHLSPPDVIYETASRILQEGGHTGRLQIQISENVPPHRWRTSYPEILRAIRDFGKP